MKESLSDVFKEMIRGLIFDLDGVITKTQKVHQSAWKELFDDFLGSIDDVSVDIRPMSKSDYMIYIDGKPRYEGVRSFLRSRNLELDYGSIHDTHDKSTICGLGNRKNLIFNKLIDQDGVDVYEDAIEKIIQWRNLGFKTAIVSSSKNCKKIVEKVGLENLFDTRVDGLVSEELHLRGKPDPDIFIEAANNLKCKPQECVVFEDAISGVHAGQRGNFGLVVGVSRFDNRSSLLENGADIAVDTFKELDLFGDEEILAILNPQKPPIFNSGKSLFSKFKEKRAVIFLDYDGTLTPIVNRPEDAVISDEMRHLLEELSEKYTVAIITGRDIDDIKKFINLDNLIYAGSHGYSIIGPNDLYKEHEKAEEIVSTLDEVEHCLVEEHLRETKGVQVERKRYAIAVHYRNARDSDIPTVYRSVKQILQAFSGLKLGEGKKVVEIKPDLDWHKGKAIFWILDELLLNDKDKYIPIYIGDDITDEDAFRSLKGTGFGILVGSHGQTTNADYTLRNIYQVKKFFRKILDK